MSKVSDYIEAQGPRGEVVRPVHLECFELLEARIAELEATVKALSTPAQPVPAAAPVAAIKEVAAAPLAP